ncbi:MAG: S8 family serine peptidase [Hydrococcus sp. C42_A2020_068]|nr:S8 family serine peptidase [Hydrococcus sp. C42_A2020_068]
MRDLRQGSIFANDEGRAVAQIIHDIAPGAKLLFHTAIGDDSGDPSDVNDESYTKAVNALVEADVDIIFDDAQFSTSIFQDGKTAQAVQDAVSDGVVYVSAAGNNGILSYQDDYRGSNEAFSFGGKNFEAYDFDSGGNVDLFQDITVTRDGTLLLPTLTWDNPVGKVTSNLEMLLLDSPSLPGQGGNVLAVSDIPSPSASEYPIRSLAYAPIKDRKLYLSIGRELNDAPAPDRVKWISLAMDSIALPSINTSTIAIEKQVVQLCLVLQIRMKQLQSVPRTTSKI